MPSSRDTALTIAADKGHCKFVHLLLTHGAHVDVKNKKGNSPLWLACNGKCKKECYKHCSTMGVSCEKKASLLCVSVMRKFCVLCMHVGGHLDVVRLLVEHESGADVDSQDNRKVSCLMAAFRKVRCCVCVGGGMVTMGCTLPPI